MSPPSWRGVGPPPPTDGSPVSVPVSFSVGAIQSIGVPRPSLGYLVFFADLLRAATAAALAFFARATRCAGVMVSSARRPPIRPPFATLLAKELKDGWLAASWPWRVS